MILTSNVVLMTIRRFYREYKRQPCGREIAMLCKVPYKRIRWHLGYLRDQQLIKWAGTVDSEIALRSQS